MSQKHICTLAKDIGTHLKAASHADTHFASEIIQKILRSNSPLKKQVLEDLGSEDKDILSSIKSFNNNVLKSCKSTQEKEALHVLLQAYTHDLKADTSLSGLREKLGFGKEFFYKNIKSVELTNSFKHKQQKTKDKAQFTELRIKSILDFCHCVDSSHLDSNAKEPLIIKNKEGKIIRKCARRVWHVSTIKEQYSMYLESETVDRFKRTHPEFIPAKMTMFYENRCPCVLQPSMQSCVDIIRSTNMHYMRAISKFIRNNRIIKEELTQAPWVDDLNDNPENFIDKLSCPKVPHPELVCGIGNGAKIPSFVSWKCAKGECAECAISKTIDTEKCQVLMVSNSYTYVLEWRDAPRQGATKNGKQRTQLELTRVYIQVRTIMSKFLDYLPVARIHQAQYRWINHMRQLDIIMSNALYDRLFLTDFGATLNLEASEKDNSSVANHAVICIIFVVMNWRRVKIIHENGEVDETIISDCEKWIFFGDTLSVKGKKTIMFFIMHA